jgi:hypothetical protein
VNEKNMWLTWLNKKDKVQKDWIVLEKVLQVIMSITWYLEFMGKLYQNFDRKYILKKLSCF